MGRVLWNNCELICSGGKLLLPKLKPDVQKAFNQYTSKFGKSNNIWYDHKKKVCTGMNQTLPKEAYEYSFILPAKKFLTHKGKVNGGDAGGKHYVEGNFGATLGKKMVCSPEYIRQDIPFFNQFKDKTILIVGAGPSTHQYDWTKINYDYIWSCNHFFMNKELAQREVALWTVGNEVKLTGNPKLKAYMKKFPKSHLCLQATEARPAKAIKEASKEFPKQVTYAHMRYRSRLGTMPRLLFLAIFCQPKNIFFVGMDGLPTKNLQHAFEPGKKPRGAPNKPGAEDIFRRQYTVMWDYILNHLKPNIQFFNLGENTAGNMSADPSKDRFPLVRLDGKGFRHLRKK